MITEERLKEIEDEPRGCLLMRVEAKELCDAYRALRREPVNTGAMSEELLPCPWCGSPAKIEQASNDPRWWIIRCTDQADDAAMACRVVPELQDDNRAMAVVHWNHREFPALRREPGEVVEALRNLIKEFDDMDEHRPLHAGCIQCTEGATPDRYNTGLCAYHKAKAALSGLLCCALKNCLCDKCDVAFDHLRLPALASSQAGKCESVQPAIYWAVRHTHNDVDAYMLDTEDGWTWVPKADDATRHQTQESAKFWVDSLSEKYPAHNYSAVRVTSYRPTQEPGR